MKKNHLAMIGAVALIFCFVTAGSGLAREYKGVTFPDTETIGGATCKLNGIGLRKKLVINVYLGAIYLEKP